MELPTFKAVSKQPGLVELQDGDRLVFIQELPFDDVFDVNAVKAMLGAAATGIEVDSIVDGRRPFRATFAGDTHVSRGWVAVKNCDVVQVLIMAIAMNDASLDDVAEAQRHARCLHDGEEPRDWPSAEESP
ncbi:hypothetical protein BH11MYX2_BH11MYX2_38800 [soil metagenome]